MPKVTVVTSTYNRGKQNITSIYSILEQSFQDFQYIVVNDGSTDETKEILSDIRHPNLTIVNQKNKGLTNTFTDILKEIETPYVAIHGSGDISSLTRLEKQIELIDSNKDIGAVGCHVRNLYQDGQQLSVKVDSLYLENPLPALIRTNYFSHGEVMFRYSSYLQSGGYRNFFKYAQDRDLWLRMANFCAFAKVDDFLYDRIIIPNNSVGSDFIRVEKQAKFSAFAVYLAKQSQSEQKSELIKLDEASFLRFQKTLSQDFYSELSCKILQAAKNSYCQTGDYSFLLKASHRALELEPKNVSAKRYVKVIKFFELLNNLGLKFLSKIFNQSAVFYIAKRSLL